jgi:hypothetical protein
MVKMGMRIRRKHRFNSGGQVQISQFAFLFVMAFLGSLMIFPRLSPQRDQELKDRALLKQFALTPVYWDEQGVRPIYGTIKVEFRVDGTVTQSEEWEETTTTYRANASWTLQYDQGGVTETKTLSGTGNTVTVRKLDGKKATTKTTYSLDPGDAVSMQTYGPEGEAEFGVTASKKQKCCYFSIGLWEKINVHSHLDGRDYDGQTYSLDFDQTWHISIPSHWQGLAECLAAHKEPPCPAGIIEGTFSDGKTFGSHSAPVFFTEGAGFGNAWWEPELRALGKPVDGSGLPYVQGTVTVTWNLGGKVQDVEAVIIPPEDYESWKPEGGENEKTAGNDLQVKVRLQTKGTKDKDTQEKARFTFELIDVSKEPGVCLNWPVNGKDDLDLKIDEAKGLKVTNKGQKATTDSYYDEFEITIKSYDWGGYGRLKVTAETRGDKEPVETVYVEGHPNQKELLIPIDRHNNHIADYWEEHEVFNHGGNSAISDTDLVPEGDGHQGDGFSFYEEYRGFMTKKGHVRTNPFIKTLFVESSVPNAKAGIELFSAASGLEVYELGKNQMDKDRVVNCNGVKGGFAYVTTQHGLRMMEAPLDRQYPGQGYGGLTSRLGPPKNVAWVKIQKNFGSFFKLSEKNVTIAHELGHAVHIDHHGDGNYYCRAKPDCLSELTKDVPGLLGRNPYIAVQHGENSGVESCIMRYNTANYYERSGLVRFVWYGTDEAPLTIFCDSKEGTGVNGPPSEKTGSASRGNCRGQICVSDNYY